MTLKRISLLAFALYAGIAGAQTQIATNTNEEYFDEGQVILEARKKGIPDRDITGYVNAARSRFMVAHHHPAPSDGLKRATVVNLNNGRMSQQVMSTQCQNSDFSMGDYSNWTGDISNSNSTGSVYPVNVYSGTGINGDNGNPVLSNTDPCGFSASTDRQVVMSTPILGLTNNSALAFGNGYDPTCQNTNTGMFDLSMTPVNGTNCIRLGSAYPYYTGEKLRYQLTVSSANSLFTYRYAVVISDGGHGVGDQPAFTFQLKDQNGNPIGGNCGMYAVDATQASTDTSYTLSSSTCMNIVAPTYYRKWHTVTLDLSTYVGQTVYADFETMDCTYSGHYCYAYISANCGNLSATVSGFCGTSGTAVCQAPAGFASYQWYGPNNMNAIPGATSQIYAATGASLGDVFTVNCVTLQGCTTKLSVTVVSSNISAAPSSSPSCRAGSTGSASVTVNGSSGFSYTWNTGATTAGITGVPPGCYTVHIVDNSGNCPPKDTTVCVLELPPPVSTATAQLCGTQAVLTSPPSSPFTWYNNSNANTGVSTQNYTVTNGNNGDHYTVTYKDPGTGCLDSLQYTMNQVNISFTSQQTNPCNGGNNGSITLSPASGNSYTSFDWTVNGVSPPANGTANGGGPILYDSLMAGGTYTVSINAAGNPTCSYTLSVTLSPGVIPPPALETIKGCAMDNKSIPTFTTTGHSHAWYSGSTYQGNSYPFITSGVTSGATYTDTMRDNHGCVSIYKATMTLQKFTASLSQIEGIHCHDDSSGKLKATANSEVNGPLGTAYSFNWMYPAPYTSPATVNAGVGTPQSSTASTLHPGTYTVIIRSGGCSDTLTKTLTNPPPLDTDTLYAFFCPKDSLALMVVKELNHPKYTWLLNHTTPVTASQNQYYQNDSIWLPTVDVYNYWVAYLDGGCKDTAKILLTFPSLHALRPDTTVNVFTPNGDNRNDYFYPFYTKGYSQHDIDKQMESFEMYIYNRWGKLVFNTDEYAKAWDGKDQNGKEQDDGTYYFILKYKSNCGSKADVVSKHGFVQLLR
jgi:gliding motility-associated-like protein